MVLIIAIVLLRMKRGQKLGGSLFHLIAFPQIPKPALNPAPVKHFQQKFSPQLPLFHYGCDYAALAENFKTEILGMLNLLEAVVQDAGVPAFLLRPQCHNRILFGGASGRNDSREHSQCHTDKNKCNGNRHREEGVECTNSR